MTDIDILTKGGLKNAAAIVNAAATSGVPLYIAAAFVEQESGGANVYGHDAGGLFPGKAVTQSNFKTFLSKVVRDGHTSNGVGPLQITYPGYFKQNPSYPFWDPEHNILFGLQIIQKNLPRGLNAAAQLYNSGSATGAPSYGESVVNRAAKWKSALQGVAAATSTPRKRWEELVVDGSWGPATTRALQAYLSTNPKYKTLVDGVFGRGTVRQLQRWLRVTVDGKFGVVTKTALQRVLHVKPDGNFGPVSVSALQRFLNARNG